MTDTRAITVWVALDDATIDNGAMWYVPGSHLEDELRPHRTASEGSHILMTDAASEAEGTCAEIRAGDAVLWHGRTLHYSRGNTTDRLRRTYITNFRPEAMVAWERENGFNHLRDGFEDYDRQRKAGGDVYDEHEPSLEVIRTGRPGE